MKKELSTEFQKGIKLFNSGNFYECHDVLEDVWFDVSGRDKDFYQGLIHLAVGFYHITGKNNPKGALLQLNKAVIKLIPYKPIHEGINLGRILPKVEDCIRNIQKFKDGKINKFEEGLIPKLGLILK